MTTSSPPREFAVEIVRRLRAAGHTALLAGGCVRDLLLGREPKDYDVATTARPEQVRELFGHRRTLAVGASFGVIVVTGPREAGHVEVATFRTEGPYHDGRRPESVAFCTPEEDAQRRDFTINGMFYDPIDARVLDFVGGEADLAARVIRAIGDPHERMREDKLRMLRAVRFAATLDFALDEITAAAVREMADEIVVVSQERIAQELRRMLVDPHRRRAVELCADVRLLNVILPELGGEREPEGIRPPLRKLDELTLLQQPSFELAFATLLHSLPARPVVYDICHRLRLSNDETDRIEWLVAHQDDLADAPSQMPARLKRTLAHPYRDDLIALLRVKRLAHAADMQPVLFCDE
ncbi:MAG: CCA tRNA nucleotidyltransferase, partial [Candidatus Saccharimonas sp.]|nr:CCA tRNA nucleotidyltransferase [Planctomycetaceae bacterium]